MRNLDGTLNGNLGDNNLVTFSGSLVNYVQSTINENETNYNLLSFNINKPPVITNTIGEASTPVILPYVMVNGTGNNMYHFSDGTVKVSEGVSINLKVTASQPNVLNIENGIPTIIPPKQGLSYRWRKDNRYITNSEIASIQSSLVLVEDTIIITNIQPIHGGTYVCEVSNDIGSILSEYITIEVYNLDIDSFFYRNLVVNPYGKDGVNNWNANTGDFTTKPFYIGTKADLYKPNRVDLFGYTPDMMVPRPYQIDSSVLKGLDMYKDLTAPGECYFTRGSYKYEKKGGKWLVNAYQDVDISALQELIKGGIYGVEGVRAVFSCYIGSALPAYYPNNRASVYLPHTRTDEVNYNMKLPRLSLTNFESAGPSNGIDEKTTVTIEEYNGETRLASTVMAKESSNQYTGGGQLVTARNNQNYIGYYHIHTNKGYMAGATHTSGYHDYLLPINGFGAQFDSITLQDPWSKRLGKYTGQIYNTNKTSGQRLDAILFCADELWGNGNSEYSKARSARPTYGQYIEFNKVAFDRLHRDTTKIRISITFEYMSSKWSETYEPFLESSDEIYEIPFYSYPYGHDLKTLPPTTDQLIFEKIKGTSRNSSKQIHEYLPKAGVPRGMVTGLNLSLIPISTYNANRANVNVTAILAKNNTPEGIISNGLQV